MTAHPAASEAPASDAALANTVQVDLRRAFDMLDAAGISWLILRGSAAGDCGDIDLLVHPVDQDRIGSVLVAAGFVLRRAPEHRPHRLFVSRSSKGDRWLVLDVLHEVESVGARSALLSVADAVLSRLQRDDAGLPRPAPTDAAWLQLIRSARPKSGDSAAARVDLVKPPLEGPVPVALDAAVGAGTATRLHELVMTGDQDHAREMLALLATRLRQPPPRVVGQARRIRNALAWGSEGRRGVSLAVLGPDGAGKSTLIEGLAAALPLAVSVHYLGVFRTSEREQFFRRMPGVALAGKLATLRGRSLQGAVDARRGRIVLFDRHVVDALLRPGKRTTRSRVSYWLLARSCPPPDLFVVLDAPGELMFARKGEHTVEILEERRQRYLELRGRYANLAVVDATASAEQVLQVVENLVWQLYAEPAK